jgi:hypothetical protein
MRRFAVILLAIVAFGMGGASICAASVRPYEKLSVGEQIALQESERRVCVYDRELQTLDRERAHRKISADDYEWSTSQLTFCIQQESLYQNGILKGRPISVDVELPDGASKVLRTVGKYTVGISAAILEGILEGILKGGGNFSP